MRLGVIDIGTNSTRLLVADVEQGRLEERERRSTVTQLGRGVDITGQLSNEAIDDVCEAVGDYLALCREHGVDRPMALATSAVRDAANGAAFMAELRERFGLEAEVIDGEREARLTYLGATAGREPSSEPLLVIDIGGGSTELVVGHDERVDLHASLQAGVVRHTERYLQSDPPGPKELEDLAADVRKLIDEAALASRNGRSPAHAIAVAGTPTSLAAIDLELEPFRRELVQGHVLGLETIQRMCSSLSSKPLDERREVPGLHPRRAPTIVAGTVILIQVMRAFGLDRVEASEHDILWGAALEAGPARAAG